MQDILILSVMLIFHIHGVTVLPGWCCFSDLANDSINKLSWKKVAIIHDNESAGIVLKLERVELMVHRIDEGKAVGTILREIYDKLFPDVNVIVASENMEFLAKVLYEADGLDNKMNHSTDWSHHSRWLVLTQNVSYRQLNVLTLDNLQNVAIMILNHDQCASSVDTFSLTSEARGYKFHSVDINVTFLSGIFPNLKYRYNRRVLRVSTLASHPFVIPKNIENEEDIPYTGYCIEILRTIAEHLNLTLKFVKAKDNTWGWIHDGMMGQLTRREIDFVASEMNVHVERAQHMDYIMPYLYFDQLILLYKMPQGSKPIFLLAQPFEATVYIAYFAAIFAVTIVFILIELYSKSTPTRHKTQTLFLCWDVIRSSLKQGDAIRSSTVPGRVIVPFFWAFVMVISSLYCGNLTASLASSSPFVKFRNVDELISSDFTVGFRPGGITKQILKNSSRGDMHNIFNKIKRINTTDPEVTSRGMDYHIHRVKRGKYAFLTYRLSVDAQTSNNCTLSSLFSDDMTQGYTAFVVQKDSPFKEDIYTVMHQLRSTGILNRLWSKWTNQTKTTGTCGDRQFGVTLSELIGGLIMAGAGIMLSCISLLVEKLTAWRFRN